MSEYEGRIYNDGILYEGSYELTSDFGPRIIDGVQSDHKGIDFVGKVSKYILSPVNGVVVTSTIITDSNNLTSQWGNYVRIDSNEYLNVTGAPQRHYLCHMSQRLVSKGQQVKKGDIIGIEGDTGLSYGSHCHYEVRNSEGASIDPKLLFWSDDYNPSDPVEIDEIIYKSISEVPEWAQSYVQNWIDKGILIGIGSSLNLTMSMIRTMIMTERMMGQISTRTIEKAYLDSPEISTKIQNYLLNNTSDVNYIKMVEQYTQFITASTEGITAEQVKDRNGNLIYWTNNEHEETTINETSYPVMIYGYEELIKAEFAFKLNDTSYTPQINYYNSNTGETINLKLGDDGIHSNIPTYTSNANIRNIIVTSDTPTVDMGNVNDVIYKLKA